MNFVKRLLFAATIAATLPAHAQQVTPGQNKALLEAKQGSIVLLDHFLTEKFEQPAYQKMVLPGPQFLISDDPEYIRVPEAVVLQEKVTPGAVRLYVYNVNGVKEPAKIERRITAVIRNTGTGKMSLRMIRYSSQKPTTSYFMAGKKGLADYFAAKPSEKVCTIKPGETVAIDEQLEKNVVKYDELVHGIYEFVIDQPGEISVLQTDLKTSGPKALARIKQVHPVGHKNAGRGLFGVSEYGIRLNDTLTAATPFALSLADGNNDPWVVGVEGSTGATSYLAGNYGVMYRIRLNWKSTNGKGLALVTWNARSADNKWCGGMANTMVVSGGKFPAGIVQLPSDVLRTKGAPEAVLVQVFPPGKEGEVQTIEMTYSPPGASCLPTPLIFIPVDMK